MNETVNNFFFVSDKFLPEMHLRHRDLFMVLDFFFFVVFFFFFFFFFFAKSNELVNKKENC